MADFLLVWAGVLIGFFYLVLIPGGERLERLKEEKRNMEDQVIVLERKVRNSEGLEKKLTELHVAASLLEERLPEEKEVSNLLLVIEDSALRSGVEVQSLKPQSLEVQENSDKPQSDYLEVSFESDLVSDYYGFLLFLNYLRQSPRLIQVKNFNLEEDENGNLLIAMRFSTYVFSQVEANEEPRFLLGVGSNSESRFLIFKLRFGNIKLSAKEQSTGAISCFFFFLFNLEEPRKKSCFLQLL